MDSTTGGDEKMSGPKPYSVIVWGTGIVGQHALRYLLPRPDLRLVGVKCHSQNKDGIDAGALANGGFEKTGIRATRNRDAILALDADIVIFVPFDPLSDPSVAGTLSSQWVPDLLDLLKSGKNIVTSILSIAHWRHLKEGAALHSAVEAAGREGNASLYVTGIDPGFVPDAFAYAASGIVSEITEINTWEVLDYGSYEILPAMRMLGFGSKPDQVVGPLTQTLYTCWGGCPHVLADAFGVTLDTVTTKVDFALAKQRYVSDSGLEIDEGTIEAINFRIAGVYRDKDLFSVNHITRMGQQSGPEYLQIGADGGYGIEIKGYPPMRADFPFGLPGGTGKGWSDAMVMTSSRLVNSIASVKEAAPGWRLFRDLKGLGGRFALKLA
jgi:4-hydroxy-tetrahydrodipicolinate reductase